ncbi:nucleotidyltransferase domain-containing protein [Pantoea sp. S61]|uniref:nucleotidyltransferase domain-containing protein n=1 Tax=Pantoea sp. S61 TaxID=2767442 RepID=UPI00190D538F|nr:nucleotidyltransferase domain-containing protein [Pantoea sp. S61]MBK0123589.1 nucleotidyltransferase domain-containing protein [Pantoea sp. S61]
MVALKFREEFEKNYNTYLPKSSLAALQKKSIEANVIYDRINHKAGDIVLFTGSYSTGEHNPTSDVDILILSNESEHERRITELNHPSIFGDSFDIRYKETDLNIEYIKLPDVFKLLSIVNTATNLYQPDLPNLQGLELRLAVRIYNGIPLLGEKDYISIKKNINIASFTSSATALSLVMAISYFEDSLYLSEIDSRLILSNAAFCLVMSYVNSSGNITYSVKNLRGRAISLFQNNKNYYMLNNVDSLLFVSDVSLPVGQKLVIDMIIRLIELLQKSEYHDLTLKMLAPYLQKIPNLLNTHRA